MRDKIIYALGYFDGVHRGHQALLDTCRRLAKERDCHTGVVTFEGHPDTLVLGKTPKLINTPEDRLRLLKSMGMESVVVLPFDRAMMEMPWQEFYRMLKQDYNADGLVCGYDFRFGRRGEGSGVLLKQACEADGLICEVTPEQEMDQVTVSSTYIRTLLEAGDMERANAFLGHPHIFTGQVVPGRQLGRTIGIPTANLHLPEGLVELRRGVYACLAKVSGGTYMAVTNVGVRPTVGGHRVTVEPWILDFSGDLYGRELTLEFYRFLRPEKKFDSLELLREEIQKNACETREYFAKNGKFPFTFG